MGFDRFHPNISNPCRDDERGIDAAQFPAHTRHMANNCDTTELTTFLAGEEISGMVAKSKEFLEKGAEVYAQA